MRTLFYVFSALILMTVPALAGSVSYVDLRGKWQSTSCTAPVKPPELAKDSEAAADDLNAYRVAKNKYSQEAGEYMNCLSKEAQRDSEATGILITKSAQAMIDQVQGELNALHTAPKAD